MNHTLEARVRAVIGRWRQEGLPSHETLAAEAEALRTESAADGACALWSRAPLLLTATLDDALGQGLAVIHHFADAVGLRRRHIGLTVSAEAIIAACNAATPDLLGMTILQFDSEGDLQRIRQNIPATTRMVCGGPIFRADTELAERCGIDFVATDVGAFLQYLLDHRETLDANT